MQYDNNRLKGVVFDIKRFAIHDGTGIRSTVFFKGCPMRCPWCHNPESQIKEPQKSASGAVIGAWKTVEQVMAEIEKDRIFYDESAGGVTFSGGEPLAQPGFLGRLLDVCRQRDIHTILDTSGCASAAVFDAVKDKVDRFHYDLKLMDDKAHLAYTGVSNRPVKHNLTVLAREQKDVVVRFPVIPGITDTPGNIADLARFVSALKNIERIDLLPFHPTAGEKYRRLKIENPMAGIPACSSDTVQEIKQTLTRYGFNVTVGG